jgi:hypothetical protein
MEVVKTLLHAGADRKAKNRVRSAVGRPAATPSCGSRQLFAPRSRAAVRLQDGKTPAELAEYRGYKEVAEKLRDSLTSGIKKLLGRSRP